MKLTIIGAGNVGKALASSAVKAGHDVTITSRNPEHYGEAASQTGSQGASLVDALDSADAVVLAVPSDQVDNVVREVGDKLDGKTLVDATNRVNPADPGLVLDGSSNAEKIQAALPGAHVVKAFNTNLAAVMANPATNGGSADGYVAGDNEAARKQVGELMSSMGLRPIDAGPLAMARALEGMALLNISLQIRNDWPWQSAWKLEGPTGQ